MTPSSVCPMAFALYERAAIHLGHQLIALVVTVMAEDDDAGVFTFRVSFVQHLAVRIERVSMRDRLRETNVVETEFRKRIFAAILTGKAENKREIHTAIGKDASERRVLHHMRV